MRRVQGKNTGKAHDLTLFHRPCYEHGVLCENYIAGMFGTALQFSNLVML